MDKKIVSLLNNNLRVIIPDFGAFIIRQQEPRIVVFNELLKNNDGLLIDHIMKSEGVETDVALQLLSDYTSQALRTMESGKVLTIEGLGTLQKDKNGRIAFTQEDEIITLDEPAVFEIKNEPSADSVKAPEPRVNIENYSVKADTGTRVPLLSSRYARWIIVFLAANLVIIAFFVFKDDIRNLFRKDKEPAAIREAILNQLADSVISAANDTAIVFSEGPSVPMLEEVTNPEHGELKYYIVAGCFRDEINADELVGSLKKIGYKAEKFGKIGDLYAVSFASFDNKELAVKELARIREEFHPDAWMTRF
jgi:nucleoid DNA-binding protein